MTSFEHHVQNVLRVQNAVSWVSKFAVGAHFRGCVWLENFVSVSEYAGVVWSGARFRGCSFSRVHRPYAFGAFPSSLWSLRSLRRSAFLFQLFFVSPLKQKWHKSVIRNNTKSVTSKPEHVRLFLLFEYRWSPTACQSMTFLQHVQDSSALSMLTKTYML